MRELLTISTGAVVGANLRYLLGLAGLRWWPHLPAGTLVANLVGSFGLALFIALISSRPSFSPHVRLMIVTGFFGSLTTFSTFSFEVVTLIQRQQLRLAAGYALLSVAGALSGVVLGLAAGEWLARHL